MFIVHIGPTHTNPQPSVSQITVVSGVLGCNWS